MPTTLPRRRSPPRIPSVPLSLAVLLLLEVLILRSLGADIPSARAASWAGPPTATCTVVEAPCQMLGP